MKKRVLYYVGNDPARGPAVWRASDPRQLSSPSDVRWLDPRRLWANPPVLSQEERAALAAGRLSGVNLRHPHWQRALAFVTPKKRKKRVHLLAEGDAGSALLTALKLLGGKEISVIGVRNPRTGERWAAEMGQISWPWDYGALPEVEAVPEERLFDCDVFLFVAEADSPMDGGTQDGPMARLEASRPLAEHLARQAREADFRGLFAVLSDPADPLCQAAWRASNTGPDGVLDHKGLLPEQVHGFGLGVMNARAACFAKQDPRFAAFLTDGQSFGPGGQELVIANSVQHYDDALSRELTRLTLEGFKPSAASAVSSGAIQLLLALRGQWHCGSVPMGGVWFGCRNRFTAQGLELETLDLPDALFDRLRETERALHDLT